MNKSFPVLIAVFGLLGVASADAKPFEWKFIASTDKRLPRRIESYRIFKSFEFNVEQLRAIVDSPDLPKGEVKRLKKEQFSLLPSIFVPTADGNSTKVRILESNYYVSESRKRLYEVPDDFFVAKDKAVVRTTILNFNAAAPLVKGWSFVVKSRQANIVLMTMVTMDFDSGTGFVYEVSKTEVPK
jgi:hypothetical protein